MTPKDILRDTARWFETHDWLRRSFGAGPPDNPTACCVLGALRLVSGGSAQERPAAQADCDALDAATRILRASLGDVNIANWNDGIATDKAEVIAQLYKAAA